MSHRAKSTSKRAGAQRQLLLSPHPWVYYALGNSGANVGFVEVERGNHMGYVSESPAEIARNIMRHVAVIQGTTLLTFYVPHEATVYAWLYTWRYSPSNSARFTQYGKQVDELVGMSRAAFSKLNWTYDSGRVHAIKGPATGRHAATVHRVTRQPSHRANRTRTSPRTHSPYPTSPTKAYIDRNPRTPGLTPVSVRRALLPRVASTRRPVARKLF